MMSLINNKKANPSWFLITIIVSVVSFLLYLVVFSNITTNVVSQTDDLACRTYVSLKDFEGTKIGEFFYTINEKCKKDEVKITSSEEDEVYKEVGDLMKRCWYRYGEGEYDFLSNWRSTGQWCFSCGEIEFSDSVAEEVDSFSYSEFVKWSKDAEFKLKDGNKSTYFDYMNLRYSDYDEDELKNITEELLEAIKADDGSNREVLTMLSSQQKEIMDLRLKEIDPDDKTYVVYRYDRLEGDAIDKAISTITTGIGGVITGIAVGSLVENALWVGGSALVCTAGNVFSAGFAAPVCAGMVGKTAVNIANSARKGLTAAKRITGINALIKRVGSGVKFSKKERTIAKLEEGISFGKADEIEKAALALKKIDPDLSEQMLKAKNVMDDLGVDNIDDIGDAIRNLDKATANSKRVISGLKKSVSSRFYRNKGAALKQRKRQEMENIADQRGIALEKDKIKAFEAQIDKYKELEDEVFDIMDKASDPAYFSKLPVDEKLKVRDYIKGIIIVGAGTTGAAVGFGLDSDSNQYVDVMTQEQYYRLCGTDAGNFE